MRAAGRFLRRGYYTALACLAAVARDDEAFQDLMRLAGGDE